MFKISLTECLVIGLITVVSGLIINFIVSKFGNEDSKENNFFAINKEFWWFWLMLFLIGISIHLIISYADIKNWQCEKICTDDVCKIICIIPINGLTDLLVTK